MGGEYRTKEEIRNYLLPLLNYENTKIKFEIEPKYEYPYVSGKLSQETIDIGLKLFNYARYAAGIPNNVKNDPIYEKFAQDASLLMRVNKKMAHFGQPKPSDMDDELFKSGEKGCVSCNLYVQQYTIFSAMHGWVEDHGNFYTVGHRRWILNPVMNYTGFGNVDGYSAMYCLDNTFGESTYKNIPWPCRNMAIEFGTTKQWILSLGREAPNDIEVTVTDYKTGNKKKYSQANPSEFYISNVAYGLNGCIIFNGPYGNKDGDSYRVDVKGTNVAVSYDVNFFLYSRPARPAQTAAPYVNIKKNYLKQLNLVA